MRKLPSVQKIGTILVFLTATLLLTTTGAALGPENISISSVEGQDPGQVNQFNITNTDRFKIELEGPDEYPRPLHIEIGGETLASIDAGETEVRPYSDTNVTEGKQTLEIILEERGERTVLAETEVEVTNVDMEVDQESTREKRDLSPEDVEILEVNGQDVSDKPEIEIKSREELELGVEGIDGMTGYLSVYIDGKQIGHISDENRSFRPIPDTEIPEGEKTLELVSDREETETLDEVNVEITEVDLTEDRVGELEFDPENVEISRVMGQDVGQEIKINLTYSTEISVQLEGADITEHGAIIKLDGKTVTSIEKGETSSRPRKEADISEGEQELEVYMRAEAGKEEKIGSTTVEITEINLERETAPEMEFDPEKVSIESIKGKSADNMSELKLGRQPIKIEMSGIDVKERVITVKLDGNTIGMAEEGEDEFYPRTRELEEGVQKLEIFTKKPRGGDVKIGEKELEINIADSRRTESINKDAELEILSIDGKSTEERVLLEKDLRGEVPVEIEVEGLSETEASPYIMYKREFYSPDSENFHTEGDTIKLDHLPRVEDGDKEKISLVVPKDQPYIFDSAEVEFRNTAEETQNREDDGESGGGVVNTIRNFFGGEETEEETGRTAEKEPDREPESSVDQEKSNESQESEETRKEKEPGTESTGQSNGIINRIRGFLGF